MFVWPLESWSERISIYAIWNVPWSICFFFQLHYWIHNFLILGAKEACLWSSSINHKWWFWELFTSHIPVSVFYTNIYYSRNIHKLYFCLCYFCNLKILFMYNRYMQAVVDEIVLANVNPLKVLNIFTLYIQVVLTCIVLISVISISNSIQTAGI